MKKKFPASTAFFAVVVLLLAGALTAIWYITQDYAIVGLKLYPKDQELLDVRGTDLSESSYESLARMLPRTQILWDVPFGGSTASSDSKSLTVTDLSQKDVDTLVQFPELETVNAEGCTDYDLLLQMVQRYPEVSVSYSVPVDGQRIPGDAGSITVGSLSQTDIDNLRYLPELKTIDASACWDYDTLLALKEAHPEWNILITDTVAGQKLDRSGTSLEASGAGYDELCAAVHYMKDLRSITLHDPAMDGEHLLLLRQENPNLTIHWDVTYGGQTWADDIEEIDISATPLTELDSIRTAADKLPNLQKLILEKGSLTDEDIYAYRLEVKDRYRVVWTVVFSNHCSARTDQDWFMPTKVGEYYFKDYMAVKLKYMEDVVSLDLGHHPITNTDFLQYMTKIVYLDLTDTQVKKLTYIECLQDLVYLEFDWNYLQDIGNIDQCKKLEDLSISTSYADLDTICSMTWLKNLRWRARGSAVRRVIEALPDTTIYIDGYNPGPLRWRELPNYYKHREILGMPPMEEY